jgi:hypothetical protein
LGRSRERQAARTVVAIAEPSAHALPAAPLAFGTRSADLFRALLSAAAGAFATCLMSKSTNAIYPAGRQREGSRADELETVALGVADDSGLTASPSAESAGMDCYRTASFGTLPA